MLPKSIKIQIEDPQRKSRTDELLSKDHPLAQPGQQNTFKLDNKGYLSLSQKKKAQQYWNVPQMNRPVKQEEFKQMYHVTIQIDPSTAPQTVPTSP